MEGHAQGAILDALKLEIDRIGELDLVLLLFLDLFIAFLALLTLFVLVCLVLLLVFSLLLFLFLFLQQLVLGFAEVEAVPGILGQE